MMMATEEYYRQEEFIPDNQNPEFKTRLQQLYGKDYIQEAVITLAACQTIHSYEDILDLVNAGPIKLVKKKGEEIKGLIKSYYQKKASQKRNILRDGNDVEELFQFSLNQVKDKMKQSFQVTEFKPNYLENIQSVQQVFQNGFKQVHEIFQKKQLQDICWRQPLKSQLTRNAQTIIKAFYPKNMDTQEAALDIAGSLEFDCFETGIMKIIANDPNKQRMISIIQKLRSFSLLQEFAGEEIEVLEPKFTVEFYLKFSNVLSFSLIKQLCSQFLKNPEYNWTNRKDINEEQNKKLIEELWLKQNFLLQLMKAFKTKETLQNRIKKQVKTIIYFLTSTCNINLNVKEIETIKKNLTQFDLVSFFDSNPSVKPCMKRTYQFMNKNCPNYMKALINQEKCSIRLRNQKQMLLKKKLFENIDYFSIKNWREIQEGILKGNVSILDKYIHDKDIRYELSVWVRNTMEDYYKIILKTETLKSQATSEIMSFIIDQDIGGLLYKDIVDIKDNLLKFPYQDYIQTNIKISFENQSKIRKAFPTLKVLAEYRKSKKIELSVLRQSARIKIEPAVDRLNQQIPTQIHISVKKMFIDSFLECPLASSIYEQSQYYGSYRRDFISAVHKIEQVQEYIRSYNRISCIEKENKLIDGLSQFMNAIDIEKLKPFIFVFGEVPVSNDGKFNVDLKEQKNQELNSLMESMSLEDRKRLKQFEHSELFQSFKEDLQVISDLYKDECWQKFLLLAQKIVTSMQLPEKEHKQVMEMFYTRKTIEKILDEKLLQKYKKIRSNLQTESKYQLLVTVESSMKKNQQFFMELKLKTKIRSAYHHESLIALPKEDKKTMISRLQKGYKADIIRQYTKLTEDCMRQLINYIQSSQQYKDFYKIPAQNVQPPRNVSQPPSPSPVRTNPNANHPINPQSKEGEAQKEKEKQAKIEQQKVQQPNVAPVAVQQKPPASNVPSRAERQPTASNQQLLAKWDKLLEIKQGSLYKKARDSEYKETPLKLVEHILRSHPWTEDKITFWNAANVSGKGFLKRGLVGELKQLLANNEGLIEDVLNFQKQA